MLYTLVAYYLLGALLYRRRRVLTPKIRIFVCLLPAFFITAFRNISVGNDTYVYARAFDLLDTTNTLRNLIVNSRFESGFNIVEYAFKWVGADYYVMQVCISIFIYFSLGRFIFRYSTNPWITMFVFVTTRDMFGPMNTIRMWMAISVLLFSIDAIIGRKLLRFILLTILASMFHFSALIFPIAYFLYKVKIDFRIISITLILSTSILLLGRSFFQWLSTQINRYSGYLNSQYFDVSDNIAIYLELLLNLTYYCLLYFIHKKMAALGVETTGVDQLAYLAALLSVAMSIIGLTNAITSRVTAYFSIFLIVSLPNALHRVQRKNRAILIPAFILLMTLQFVIVITLRPHWSGIIPYSFLWD